MTEVVDVNEGRGGARLCVLLKNHEVGTRPLFHITEGAKGSSNTYFHTTKVDTADRCFARGYVWATRRCGTVRVGGGEWGADEDDCGWALPAASAGGNGYTPPVFLREYRSAGRRDTAVAALASTEQSLLSLLGDSKSEYTLVSREMCAVEVSAHETLTQPLFRMVHAASSYDTRLATQKTRKELEADGYYCGMVTRARFPTVSCSL